MSLSLSQIFVRYPDVRGCAAVVESALVRRSKEKGEIPRHVCVATSTPWLAVFAWGNAAAPELAERLSRTLEASAVWFGLSGRALAYRLRLYHLGRQTREASSPPELFATAEDFPLPAYPDAELELYDQLAAEGLPKPYLYCLAEELGAATKGTHDAVVLAPSAEAPSKLHIEEFAHRMPKRLPGVRTLFDRFDEAQSFVVNELVLRGRWDEARGKALLATLAKIAKRSVIPPGWTLRFEASSPDGPKLLDPLLALYQQERAKKAPPFELIT